MDIGTIVQLIAKTPVGREVIETAGENWVIRDIRDTEIILYSYKRDGNLIIKRYNDKDFDIKA